MVRGTKDILSEESGFWQIIEERARNTFANFGYSEIKTPLIEETALFIRSLGKTSDIVTKQIFSVSVDKKKTETQLCLRPEGTAGVIRAYLEHNLNQKGGLAKLYYLGPMFRAERPQKGRLRQFHHIGAEAIGSFSVYLDAEIISLTLAILDNFKIKDYLLKINSLGCDDDRDKISLILRKNIKPVLKDLCPDCKKRFKQNILRILDCKNENCKEAIKKALAKSGLSEKGNLCKDCLSDFNTLEETLNSLKIKYNFDPFLVRGLDYYTKTVFEITHHRLGAQDALGAGGRYNNLVKDLGGPSVGAVGFALGIERIVIASELANLEKKDNKLNLYLISLGQKAKEKNILLLNTLRKQGISSDMDYEDKSLKGQLRRANDLGVKFVGILGEDELEKGVIAVKDMRSGMQEEIKIDNFIETMNKMTNDKILMTK